MKLKISKLGESRGKRYLGATSSSEREKMGICTGRQSETGYARSPHLQLCRDMASLVSPKSPCPGQSNVNRSSHSRGLEWRLPRITALHSCDLLFSKNVEFDPGQHR